MQQQGGVATITATQVKMGGSDMFRKRIGLKFPTSSLGPARCLFGPPDVKQSREMVRKIEAKNAWSFSKRWNFDITGNPEPPVTLKSDVHEQPKHIWEEVHDENQMANCDRHRFQTPIAPNSRPVTLLYAPMIEPRVEATPLYECTAVQTDERIQVHQETQVESVEMVDVASLEDHPKKRKFGLTINTNTSSASVIAPSFDEEVIECKTPEANTKQEPSCETPFKKDRRLPKPLTIPPTSPSDMEEAFEDPSSPSNHQPSILFGNGISLLSPSESHRTPPLSRRNTIEVFAFPPFESPSVGLRCLRIRNGSPSFPLSNTKKLKQRSITEYMQVKKTKISSSKKIQ